MSIAVAVAALGLAMVSLALLLRVSRIMRAVAFRSRQTWLQLQNVISMLINAGYKVKKPRDWNDDFAETQFRDAHPTELDDE